MAFELGASMLDLSRRRRRLLLLAATGYGAYKLYNLPSVARKRRKLATFVSALISLAEAISSSAESVKLVSRDLDQFLRSDSDDLPASLKQLAKIARSDELSGSASRVSESLTIGIVRGLNSAFATGGKVGSSEMESRVSARSISDGVLDKLFSKEGSGFVSVVAGSFAKNLVLAFYSRGKSGIESDGEESSDSSDFWVQLICNDRCRRLISDCVQQAVSSAVTVYIEKTMAVNAYDELFSGLTNPKHEDKVKDILVHVCNGAVETLVRTSHRVLSSSGSPCSSAISMEKIAPEENLDQLRNEPSSSSSYKGGGWADHISSTLAVPSNRKFVLDVTGRITFETVRSFVEFFMWKMNDAGRKTASLCREEVIDRGLQVVKYASAKSLAIFRICIAFCLQLSIGTRLLTPV